MNENGTILERGFSKLPLPFGWFAVAESHEFSVGDIKTLRYFGTEFVMWRGEDGKVRALDPFCPHLGAHLGVGTKVMGNNLRCPYHFWSFNGDGGVADIPYTKVVPPKLKRNCVKSWSVDEDAGIILVWYHPKQAAPLWEVSKLPPCSDGADWVLSESHEWHIGIHIQEVTENGQDHAHFAAVHGVPGAPSAAFKLDGWVRRNTVLAEMNTPRGPMNGQIAMVATGPGQSTVEFSDVTRVLLMQYSSPIDAENSHIRWRMYHPQDISQGKMRVTKARMRDLVKQIEQDIPIWNAKRYADAPLLVEGDGPLLAYREQYAKFYQWDEPHDCPAA